MLDLATVLLQGLMQGGAVALVGAAWTTAVLAPAMAGDPGWRRRMGWLTGVATGAVLLASLATVPLTLLKLLGRIDLQLLRSFMLSTGQGEAVLWRSGLALLLFLLLLLAWRQRRPRTLAVLALLLAIPLVDSYARLSHGASMGGLTLRGLDAFHLYLAGAWGGSLWALALWPWRRRAAPATALPRMAVTGLSAVLLLFLSGLAAARSHLDPPELLFQSAYGWALIAKQLLVALTVALAALNRFRLMPRMRAAADPQDQAARQAMARGLRWEALALVTVLIATAVLTTRALPHP